MVFLKMSTNYVYVQVNQDNFYIEEKRVISDMSLLHYHDHYELYFLLSNTQRYFIESTHYEMPTNTLALIKPKELHKTEYGLGGYRFLINFNDSFLDSYFTKNSKQILLSLFQKRIISFEKDAKQIETCLRNIFQAYKKNDKAKIYICFVNLFGILLHCAETTTAPTIIAKNSTIDKIAQYIQDNYSSITTLEEVAAEMFISKYHLCHLFTKHLNTTFYHFLTEVRLKHAEEYLIKTKKNITEIAELCGFTTSSQFCFCFHKKFGVPPLKYRKLHK